MKTQQNTFVPSFDVKPVKELESGFAQRLEDILSAAERVRNHLTQYADTVDNRSLRQQAEALRTWMDINAEGLAVAARAAQLGAVWADDIQNRLETAAGDLDRISRDDLTTGASAKTEGGSDLTRVWGDVNGILDSMEALYTRPGMRVTPGKVVEPAEVFVR